MLLYRSSWASSEARADKSWHDRQRYDTNRRFTLLSAYRRCTPRQKSNYKTNGRTEQGEQNVGGGRPTGPDRRDGLVRLDLYGGGGQRSLSERYPLPTAYYVAPIDPLRTRKTQLLSDVYPVCPAMTPPSPWLLHITPLRPYAADPSVMN